MRKYINEIGDIVEIVSHNYDNHFHAHYVWYKDKDDDMHLSTETDFHKDFKEHEQVWEWRWAKIIGGRLCVTPYYLTNCEAREKNFDEDGKIKLSARRRA